MNGNIDTVQLRQYARIAGILYLIIIVGAGFSEGFVRSSLVVPSDPAATANNILANEWLFRAGFVTDLVAFISDAMVAVLLYILLKPVSLPLSLIAASLRLIAHPAIGSLNLLNHLIPLQILSNPDFSSAFETSQLQAIVQQYFIAHRTGYLIAGAFFGLHCLILGYLFYKSELFPRVLGALLVIASFGYLTESFGNFLFPGSEVLLGWIVGISAGVAEVSLCLWLLVKGVKVGRTTTEVAG